MSKKHKIQGKKNRAKGLRFERKVREDLENKGWIVSKWQNNVYPLRELKTKEGEYRILEAKLINARMGRFRTNQNGFPDFICFKNAKLSCSVCQTNYSEASIHFICGVECKTNGRLDKIEKEKCKWLLDNKIFSKILIAKQGKKRGEIEYNEFKE